MELEIFVVDAFSKKRFGGNSAAVIVVNDWLEVAVMQSIAAENNLSETAFVKPLGGNRYFIRWFSPLTEIDFCGHATLASSYVLFNYLNVREEIHFETLEVGTLTVTQEADSRIVMSFPNQKPELVNDIPKNLLDGLTIKPVQVLKNRQAYVAVLASEDEVKDIEYHTDLLKTLSPLDVVVTAQGSEYDFVSRYFWPDNGGLEDPVTGSIHAGLAPYWSEQLGKSELVAIQASKRGGVLYCSLEEDRVLVSGYGVLYLRGSINI